MKRKIVYVAGIVCCLYNTLTYSSVAISGLLKLDESYLPNVSLPPPTVSVVPPKTLSLREAIMLALRNNQGVKSSEIQRIVDKYQVILAKQVFRPQYRFRFTQTLDHSMKPAYTLTPSVSILTPVGSVFNVDYANNLKGGPGAATFTWKQPLIRDFGAVNTVPLYDALTNEKVAKLTFKNNVISAVVGVITAYRQLVQDYNNLDIQKRFLKESAEALTQYKLKVKVGKMAPSDILQQRANYETTKLAVVQQKNALQQNYQNFLSALGLVPDAKLNIAKKIQIKHFPLPSKKVAIQLALKGNIAYRQALLQLENTQRAIITAANERKWKLNFVTSATLGTPGDPSGRITTPGRGPTFFVDLQIPIDNVQGKADEVDARVRLEQAKLALEQRKEDLIRQVETQMQTIRSDWEQIKVSRNAVALQAATLKAARLRLNYGRSTVFEVTQDQDLLLQQETALVGTEITYLNDITGLQTIWGNTLNIWDIQLRY